MNSETENNNIIPEKPVRSKKGNVIFTLLCLVFCLIIFGTGIAIFISEDRNFSESENRVLAGKPVLSLYTLKEGSFMKDFETYLTDQFIFRDEIISMKTFLDRVTGKKDVGGVYVGSDGYLFEEPSDFDEKKIGEVTELISAFAGSNNESKITFILSPNSSYVNSDRFPAHLSFKDQSYQIKDIENYTESKNITWPDLSAAFLEAKEETELFYKTDHHWTTRAAYIAFQSLMSHWQKDISDTNYKFLTVADDFQGTLSSKAGVYSSKDNVEICVPQNSSMTYVVNYESQEKKTATLFEESKLGEKNKYEVFLGGNFDKITIDTTSTSKDTLLLIKDSYANCMIPMLTPHFAKIVVVDPRYMKESIPSLVEENTFTHILFMYNLNTFLEDTSLIDCLK